MRIALIHAVTVAMAPIEAAFRARWPEAERINLLDDALSVDRSKSDELTPEIAARIRALADYAVSAGADGILYTCSAFGEAIESVQRAASIPVLKPNEAMFAQALGRARRVGLLATFGPSVASMESEFRDMARAAGSDATIETVLVEPAMAALRDGDGATHDRLLAEAAPRLAHCDCVLLAQFSTARAEGAVSEAVAVPVITAPGSAVDRLRASLSR